MEKVLIVVKDENILHSLESLLIHNNYEAVTAFNPQDAIRRIYTHLPELIIIDLHFYSNDQVDLLNYIRNIINLKTTPILLLSNCQNDDQSFTAPDHYSDIIKKPYQSIDILRKINSRISERKQVIQLLKNSTSVSIDDSVLIEVIDSSSDEIESLKNSYLEEDEIIDALSRKSIEAQTNIEREEKQNSYEKLTEIMKDLSNSQNAHQLETYAFVNIKQLVEEIAKKDLRENDTSFIISEIELKTNTFVFQTILNEAVENAFKHSMSHTPVEVLAVAKDDQYVISITNYSMLDKDFDIDKPDKLGMKIIDLGCRILDMQFQITAVSNNCVKSRFTVNKNNN
jgi:DNA-binding response OmpR family regulator